MNSFSVAFGLLAFITGASLFSVAIDSSLYTVMPKSRSRWMAGLLVATLIFTAIAIIASGRDCNDYTKDDYQYGRVPVVCTERFPNRVERSDP